MHLGLVCSPVPGHLTPMLAVGQGLLARGHRVTLYTIADALPFAAAHAVPAQAVGADAFPPGSFLRRWGEVGRGPGLRSQLQLLGTHRLLTEAMCADVPALAEASGVEGLIADHLQPQAASLAERLGVPFATLASTLAPAQAVWGAIPGAARLQGTALGRRLAAGLVDVVGQALLEVVNRWRRRWGLRGRHRFADTLSPSLRLHTFPAELDPAPAGGARRVDVGPLRPRRALEFPWERLDGRPVAYLSLGTLRNRSLGVLEAFLDAVTAVGDYQAVVGMGAWTRGDERSLGVSGGTVVVAYAPQWELLRRAALCVTHAGVGITLDLLAAGVPAVAVPCADDQPADAALLAAQGLAEVVPWRAAGAASIARAARRIVTAPGFPAAAARWRARMAQLGGAEAACQAVEEALRPASGRGPGAAARG